MPFNHIESMLIVLRFLKDVAFVVRDYRVGSNYYISWLYVISSFFELSNLVVELVLTCFHYIINTVWELVMRQILSKVTWRDDEA